MRRFLAPNLDRNGRLMRGVIGLALLASAFFGVIDYRIRVHGMPIRWRTEIAEWQPPHRFVDVQLRGPYTLWHHTHTFEEREGATLCGDLVRYRPRGGGAGSLALRAARCRAYFPVPRAAPARVVRARKVRTG